MLSPASAGLFCAAVQRSVANPGRLIAPVRSTAAAAEAVREGGEKALRVTARVRPPRPPEELAGFGIAYLELLPDNHEGFVCQLAAASAAE